MMIRTTLGGMSTPRVAPVATTPELDIGLAGGLQVYAYAGNNPVNWIDPDGLMTFIYAAGGHAPTGPWPIAVGFTIKSELVQPFDSSGKLEGRV